VEVAWLLDGGALLLVTWKCVSAVRAFRAVVARGLASAGAHGSLWVVWITFAFTLGLVFVLAQGHTGSGRPLLAVLIAALWPDGALWQAFVNLRANRHR
jgi:hypothetical protein